MSKFITRLLRHSQKAYREDDGAVHDDQVIDECKEKQFDNTRYWSDEMQKHLVSAQHWSIEKWVSVLARGGRQKKRFQCCLNPNYPHQFLYLRAIHGHSGSTINPALQDNVLLSEGFTEYIHHVGNGNELRSLVNHGLISGRVSLKTGRQAVFFTVVNRAIQKILGDHFRIQYFWCNLKFAQQRGLQFYQTTTNAVIFSTTHCLQSSLRKRYA